MCHSYEFNIYEALFSSIDDLYNGTVELLLLISQKILRRLWQYYWLNGRCRLKHSLQFIIYYHLY